MKSSLRAPIWQSLCGILAAGGMLAAGSLAVLADSYQPTPAVDESAADDSDLESAAEPVPPPELSTHMGTRDSSGANRVAPPSADAPPGQGSRVTICMPQVPPLCQTMGPEPDCACQNACGCQYDPICQDACGCSMADTYRTACRPNFDQYCHLLPQDGLFQVRGWLDAGILGNTSNPASHFNGPYNSQQVDNGQFNQAYIIVERKLANDGSFSLGGRWDLLYGSDYFVAQENGVERTQSGNPRWNSSQYYGLAMPQAYLEAGTNELSAKVGHFYTIVGYEGVQSTSNFFYSHAYSYQFAGPFTHSGVLASSKLAENWQVQSGVVNGWNNLATTVNRAAFLGGIKYTNEAEGFWSSFAIITGDEPSNVAGLPTVPNTSANRTRYSFIISKKIGARTEYVFHQWYGIQQQGAPGGGAAQWYGIDQYIYYRMNDRWRAGLRSEWFRDQDGTRVGLSEPSNPNTPPLPGSYGSLTVGANWNPRTNVMIRPELRWDTYNGPAKPFDDGTKTWQLLLGCDAILNF